MNKNFKNLLTKNPAYLFRKQSIKTNQPKFLKTPNNSTNQNKLPLKIP